MCVFLCFNTYTSLLYPPSDLRLRNKDQYSFSIQSERERDFLIRDCYKRELLCVFLDVEILLFKQNMQRLYHKLSVSVQKYEYCCSQVLSKHCSDSPSEVHLLYGLLCAAGTGIFF